MIHGFEENLGAPGRPTLSDAESVADPAPVGATHSKGCDGDACFWIELVRRPVLLVDAQGRICRSNARANAQLGLRRGDELAAEVIEGWSANRLGELLACTLSAGSARVRVHRQRDGGVGPLTSFNAQAWDRLDDPAVGAIVLVLQPMVREDPPTAALPYDPSPLEWLANWLHDHPAQLVTAAKMRLHQLAGKVADPHLAGELSTVMGLLDHAGAAVRTAMAGLQPPGLFEPSLIDALKATAQEAKRDFGIRAQIQRHGKERTFPAAVVSLAVRSVREGLINAAKHGLARTAELNVHQSDDGLSLCLIDDGLGPRGTRQDSMPTPGGYGLRGLRRCCQELGGELILSATTDGGAELKLWLPAPLDAIGGGG